jgi:hypothetical protein
MNLSIVSLLIASGAFGGTMTKGLASGTGVMAIASSLTGTMARASSFEILLRSVPKMIISFLAIGAWRRRGDDFLYRKERRL